MQNRISPQLLTAFTLAAIGIGMLAFAVVLGPPAIFPVTQLCKDMLWLLGWMALCSAAGLMHRQRWIDALYGCAIGTALSFLAAGLIAFWQLSFQ